jgi:hypothetical protein
MNEHEKLTHRIRIAQLSARNLPNLALEYELALSSEETLQEFFIKLKTEIHQIHDVVLFTTEFTGMLATLMLGSELRNANLDDQLLMEAARVFVFGFYNKPKSIVPKDHLTREQFEAIYSRGKRKYS